jgi:hypothetical protein
MNLTKIQKIIWKNTSTHVTRHPLNWPDSPEHTRDANLQTRFGKANLSVRLGKSELYTERNQTDPTVRLDTLNKLNTLEEFAQNKSKKYTIRLLILLSTRWSSLFVVRR